MIFGKFFTYDRIYFMRLKKDNVNWPVSWPVQNTETTYFWLGVFLTAIGVKSKVEWESS